MRPLPRSFYRRDAVIVARELLGKILVSEIGGHYVSGRIVETEAYLDKEDPASHGYHGLTPRNRSMFDNGGNTYVYIAYGLHYCFNVVTGPVGSPQAVLIRAVEPLGGINWMRERRIRAKNDYDLCSGPGKVCQSFGININHDRLPLFIKGSVLYISNPSSPSPCKISVSTRIGISKAQGLPLRFYCAVSHYLSRAKTG